MKETYVLEEITMNYEIMVSLLIKNEQMLQCDARELFSL